MDIGERRSRWGRESPLLPDGSIPDGSQTPAGRKESTEALKKA